MNEYDRFLRRFYFATQTQKRRRIIESYHALYPCIPRLHLSQISIDGHQHHHTLKLIPWSWIESIFILKMALHVNISSV